MTRPARQPKRFPTFVQIQFAMRKQLVTLVFFCSALGTRAQVEPMLIVNANIVSVEDGKVKLGAVLIKGGKITSIGRANSLKRQVPSANRVDAKGKYLIPGLWDMHVHLEGADLVEDNRALLPVFLAYGITTVRDCASDLGNHVLAWRNEINQGSVTGPTIYTAGRKLEGKNSIWKGDLEIADEKELKQALDLLDSSRVDFVKITENTLGGDLFLKSVQAAKARGYRVSGHVPLDVAIDDLIRAGYTSIEHATYLLRLGADESAIVSRLRAGELTPAQAAARYASEFDQQRAIANYQALGKRGVFVCPTLIGGRQLAYLNETDHGRDQALSYLTKKFTANYQWRIDRMANETAAQRQERKDRYQFLVKQLPLMHKAGITFIAGSDAAALNTYVYPAESLLEELEIFEEAGLTPLQILQAATLNGALYFNVRDKTATIAEGKTADLVLLDHNPLERISALRSVNSVWVRGRYLNREALDVLLETARNTKMQLDKQRQE